jgi:hypothetical protein
LAATRPRRRHDSELLDHAESIEESPLLDDPSARDAKDRHLGHPYTTTRGREATQGAHVGSRRVTTRSASATTSSIVSVKSGNASRIILTISFTLSSPIQSGAPG